MTCTLVKDVAAGLIDAAAALQETIDIGSDVNAASRKTNQTLSERCRTVRTRYRSVEEPCGSAKGRRGAAN
jgi:hypothetical protein